MVDKDWWDTVTLIKCEDEKCSGYTYKDELEENNWECPHCGKPLPKPD
jgi:acetyl-CoA carboxylase beta subunit